MTLDTLLTELKTERDRLARAISALEGTAPRRGRPPKTAQLAKLRRRMSRQARKRLSEFKKKWWAARKASSSIRQICLRFGSLGRSNSTPMMERS